MVRKETTQYEIREFGRLESLWIGSDRREASARCSQFAAEGRSVLFGLATYRNGEQVIWSPEPGGYSKVNR